MNEGMGIGCTAGAQRILTHKFLSACRSSRLPPGRPGTLSKHVVPPQCPVTTSARGETGPQLWGDPSLACTPGAEQVVETDSRGLQGPANAWPIAENLPKLGVPKVVWNLSKKKIEKVEFETREKHRSPEARIRAACFLRVFSWE